MTSSPHHRMMSIKNNKFIHTSFASFLKFRSPFITRCFFFIFQKNKNKPDKEFFWDDRKWTLSEGISRHLSNKNDLETSQSICVFDGFYENLEEIEWMNLIESQIVSPMKIFLLVITKVLDAWTNLSFHVKTMF